MKFLPTRAAAACLAACLLLGAACSPSGHSAATGTTTSSVPPTTASVGTAQIVSTPVVTVATADGAVGYRSFGSGPPLVLIMGYGGTIDQWTPSFLAALAARFRVITPDNAGQGRTSPLPAPLTVTAMATQTSDFITALHLGRPYVLGWSMGGMIAQALTVEHPNQVSRLVLCATLPGDGHGVSPSSDVVSELQHPSSASAVLNLLFPNSTAGTAASQTYVSQILSWPSYYSGSASADSEEQYSLTEWLSGHDPGGPGIGHIAVPTLVADGNMDPLVPIANDQHLAAVVPGAILDVYPGASHAFFFQDQSQFVPRLIGFL